MALLPSRAAVIARVSQYMPIIQGAAKRYDLRPSLVAAVVCQESGGAAYAIRVERGFWRRYFDGIVALVRRTANRYDDHWAQYPDLMACSYGLLQVMLPVALERGAILEYPTELLEPHLNLDIGCKHLRWCIAARSNDEVRGLLRYNGGGDAQYAAKIQAWERDLTRMSQAA